MPKFISTAGLLAVALVALPPRPSAAQDLVVGVKGGLNIADIHAEDAGEETETDTRTGLLGGLFAEIRLGEVFALRPEGLFTRKGTSSEEEGVTVEADLDYLEVPVLLAARIPTGTRVRPRAFAGPAIAFETKCELEGVQGGTAVAFDCEEFEAEDPFDTEDTDLGVVLGAGLEVEGDRLTFLLDGRYTHGLTDLIDEERVTIENRVWSVSAAVGLKL